MLMFSFVLYSAGSGVNNVVVVFCGFISKLFLFTQCVMLFRYGCMLFMVVFLLLCVDVIVMLSAYVIKFTPCVFGVGMSAIYILNSTGYSTHPCGTPVLTSLCLESMLLYCV